MISLHSLAYLDKEHRPEKLAMGHRGMCKGNQKGGQRSGRESRRSAVAEAKRRVLQDSGQFL